MKQRAWLVDSSIYVFKAWHTYPDSLTDKHNKPINAVIGFLEFTYRLLAHEKPHLIAFAFDESLHQSHRKEIYPDYKANRSPAPESLRNQFRLCREFIHALGIHEAASPCYEADDLIGTWATTLRQAQHPVNIITADKDLAQLIHQDDHWWEYDRGIALNPKAIKKKFKVNPNQIADQLAIAGDKSDNIPGVPGIGMATAAKLLRRFDTLEQLLASTSQISSMQIRGAARIQQLIQDHQETIRLARRLTGIECYIETTSTQQFRIQPANKEQLQLLCEQLELSQEAYSNWLALNQALTLSRLNKAKAK